MINVQNLVKSYGNQVVFDGVSFLMTPGERLGLVGRNGHGKTTLFRMLTGEEQPDDGQIIMPKGYTVGHLSQHLEFKEASVLAEVQTVLGDRVAEESYRAEAALMGLGFSREDLDRPASDFSGGFQIRVNLAKVLVAQPNLMLLDEPTNYLDITSTRWLTRFLCKWPGEMIVITHDRRFLSGVTTHSMAIHRGELRRMEGSVEKLYEQIHMEEEVYENTRQNEEKKRAQEERFIERFRSKASKATLVQSRVKALEKRGRMEALDSDQDLKFHFNTAPFHASTMITVEDLRFGFDGGPELMKDLSFTIDKGDRIAIIGPNGRGKTTLLNLLADELKPKGGVVKSNPNTAMAYFGQTNIARLTDGNTIEEELIAVQPDLTRTGVRSLAGLLMFRGDDAIKKIDVLSGGERSRVLLGKLLCEPSNLLLLDEPTNHLDIESIEGLLDAVDEFPGAVVMVTHSEMILERLANRLIIFDGGKAQLFESGYVDFLERIGWQSEAGERSTKKKGKAQKRDKKELRRLRAEVVTARSKATAPIKKLVSACENRITKLEEQVKLLDAQMLQAVDKGDNGEIAKLSARLGKDRKAIDVEFADLEKHSDKLEALRAKFDAQLEELK